LKSQLGLQARQRRRKRCEAVESRSADGNETSLIEFLRRRMDDDQSWQFGARSASTKPSSSSSEAPD